jgi:hypothetical protein
MLLKQAQICGWVKSVNGIPVHFLLLDLQRQYQYKLALQKPAQIR